MLRQLGKLFLFILFSTFATVCHAEFNKQEEILNFVSNIDVNKDGSIDVTEKITAYAAQNEIKHGLVRWLPTNYKDSYGITHHTHYQIQDILVNNLTSPYHTAIPNGNYTIYIGEKSKILDPGTYIFTIRYHVDDAINFLKDGDEFYWNITGNNWDFPILYAEAQINFPFEAKILNYSAYTGTIGATGNHYTVSLPGENSIAFKTTQPLNPGEGLTVAIAIPKGIIIKPSVVKKTVENPSEMIAFIATGAILVYYLIAWNLHARNTRKGVIIPLFDAPLNLSPAAVSYIYNMGFEMPAFTAAIVSMATKGFLKIQNNDDKFTLTKISDDTSKLSDNEKSIADKLFNNDSITLDKDSFVEVGQAKQALRASLQKDYLNVYFVTNAFYLIPGLLLSLIALLAITQSAYDKNLAFTAGIWLAIWSAVCYSLFISVVNKIKKAEQDLTFFSIIGAIFSSGFALFFFAFLIVGLIIFASALPTFTMILLIIVVVLDIVFYHLMKTPTLEGRNLMDHIEGFKMYLGTAERDRLDKLNPPKKTPELFEMFLPFAIALGVENQWGEQFTDILKQAGIAAGGVYSPAWYSGSNWSGTTPAAFSNHINGGLTGALISSSSSASGGGGFSGGGGGGGGGGGW